MSQVLNVNKTGKLYVVSAPSGAGKTSLVKALMEATDKIGVAVSHTTRTQRPHEIDSVNYHFVDEVEFQAKVARGEFLEWAEVFSNHYGTSIEAANKILSTGKDLMLEIDWQGAQQVRSANANNQSIFILPPSLKALSERLHHRAQDDESTVEKRMASAFEEISHYDEFDYLIVNDRFDDALAELKAIVAGHGEQMSKAARLPQLTALISDLLPQKVT